MNRAEGNDSRSIENAPRKSVARSSVRPLLARSGAVAQCRAAREERARSFDDTRAELAACWLRLPFRQVSNIVLAVAPALEYALNWVQHKATNIYRLADDTIDTSRLCRWMRLERLGGSNKQMRRDPEQHRMYGAHPSSVCAHLFSSSAQIQRLGSRSRSGALVFVE